MIVLLSAVKYQVCNINFYRGSINILLTESDPKRDGINCVHISAHMPIEASMYIT